MSQYKDKVYAIVYKKKIIKVFMDYTLADEFHKYLINIALTTNWFLDCCRLTDIRFESYEIEETDDKQRRLSEIGYFSGAGKNDVNYDLVYGESEIIEQMMKENTES